MLMSVDLLFILSWSGHRWQTQNYLLRKRWWAASITTVVLWFTHPIPPKPSSPQVLYPAITGDAIPVPIPSSMIPSSPSRWERFMCSSSAASGITDIAACTSVCTRQQFHLTLELCPSPPPGSSDCKLSFPHWLFCPVPPPSPEWSHTQTGGTAVYILLE